MKYKLMLAVVVAGLLGGLVQAADYTAYGKVLDRVKSGETVFVSIGAVENGFESVPEAPPPFGPGLWKCSLNQSGVPKAEYLGLSILKVQPAPSPHPQPTALSSVRPLGLAPYPILPNLQYQLGGCPGGRCYR